jgi:hypothetical protein
MKVLTELDQRVENAYNWVNELFFATENGIEQGKSNLGNQEMGFCCLGFGCTVGEIDYVPSSAVSQEFAYSVGLWNDLGCPIDSDSKYGLAAMNDSGESFKHIAKEMLERPEDYFTDGVETLLKPRFDNYIEQMKLAGEW